MANAELSVKTGFPKSWTESNKPFPDVTDQTYFSERETASIDLVLNRERDESGFWRN